MDRRAVEVFAERPSRPVLQPNAGGAQGTDPGDVEVGTIRPRHGENSGTGGLSQCTNGGQRLNECLNQGGNWEMSLIRRSTPMFSSSLTRTWNKEWLRRMRVSRRDASLAI